ncbi:MAG: SigB/SigF/SigG family RNA polymerase sigma factor [Christensenellales bacterium]
MLTQEETLKLINLAQKGDENAKEELIKNNSPLIKSIIKFYKNKGVEYEDLYQLGCLGFVKAIINFNVDYNVKFSTYAVPMVAGEVKRFMRDDGMVKVSRALKSLYIQINKYINHYKSENGDSPTITEIAKNFNIEESEVMFAIDSSRALISLDEQIDDSNSNGRTLSDTIGEEDKIDKLLDNIVLKKIIKEFDERDKKIIYLRYYLDKTQSEVAKVLNVSQVQVSRLELKILEKIKQKFKA